MSILPFARLGNRESLERVLAVDEMIGTLAEERDAVENSTTPTYSLRLHRHEQRNLLAAQLAPHNLYTSYSSTSFACLASLLFLWNLGPQAAASHQQFLKFLKFA